MGQKQKAFMEYIRSGLLTFREKMDETIQMLRESNAKFIISFKWELIFLSFYNT